MNNSMKKIISLAIPIALALGFVSCQKESGLAGKEFQQELASDATLTIGFGIPEEAKTKADMADDPTIESIHVLIFDKETGVLLQTCKATLGAKTVNKNYGDPTATESDVTISSWKIDGVTMTDKHRVLHFVANLADADVPVAGTETSIFQSLATTGKSASYWQRVEVPNILPYVYDGSGSYSYVDDNGVFQEDKPVKIQEGSSISADGSYTDVNGFVVSQGDYIDYTSAKIINGTGYYASESASSKLTNVQMIRNFARIKVKNAWSSFTLKKVALVNAPASGLVAPYAAAGFPASYTSGSPVIESLSNYAPLLPAEGINTALPTEFVTADANQEAMLYVYERGIPTSSATSILMGGELAGATAAQQDDEGNSWFKVEIALESGAYFKILRDFTYNMEIGSIDASATPHASAEDAWKSAPVGDISNSPETATLNSITDGKGLMLYVQYIDAVAMNNETVMPLLYTFVYDNGSTKKFFNDKVTFTPEAKPGSTLPAATGATVTTSSDVSAYTIPDPNYTWYVALVPINAKSESNPILQSDIVVTGSVTAEDATGYAKSLTRRVTYTVMGAQRLGLKTSGVSADAAGNTTTLSITLPNTFGPSVFPITLKIEAEDNNLAPEDNLSVESGKSSFRPTATTNSYYFLKTISYSDYQEAAAAGYKFDCVFKTTKATGKTPVTKIRVTQKLAKDTDPNRFLDGDDATVELKVGSESTN